MCILCEIFCEVNMEKEVFAKGICFKKIFLLFIIGCVLGCFTEMINHYIHYGNIVSRSGLIYGPFNPVYGFGIILFVLCLSKTKNHFYVFIGGMVLGGFFEYLCSLFQEKVFGTISWDYSHQMFNIGGRTSLKYMIIWGVLALIVVKVIYPFLSNLIESVPNNFGNLITISLIIFMIFNVLISSLACLRQSERAQGLKANNELEVFLDKHYPDERLNKIFENNKRL